MGPGQVAVRMSGAADCAFFGVIGAVKNKLNVHSICVARVLSRELATFDHPGCQEGSPAVLACLPRVSHSEKVLPCLSTFYVDSRSHVGHPWGQWCHG